MRKPCLYDKFGTEFKSIALTSCNFAKSVRFKLQVKSYLKALNDSSANGYSSNDLKQKAVNLEIRML